MECQIQYAPTEAAFIAGLPVRDVQKAFDEGWFDFEPRQAANRTRRALGLAELLHLRVIKDTSRHVILQSETKKQLHRQLRARLSHFFIVFAKFDPITPSTESSEKEDTARLRPQIFCKVLTPNQLASNGQHSLLFPIIYSKHKELTAFFACPYDDQSVGVDSNNFANHNYFRFVQSRSEQCHVLFQSIAPLLKEPIHLSEISIDTSGAWKEMIKRLAETTAARLSVVSDPEIRGGEPVVRGTRIPVHLLWSLVEQGATDEELLSDYPALDEERLRLSLLYAQNHPRPGRPRKRPWQNAVRDE